MNLFKAGFALVALSFSATAAFPCCYPDHPENSIPVTWEYLNYMGVMDNTVWNLPADWPTASANSAEKIHTAGWVQFEMQEEYNVTWAYFGLSYAPAESPFVQDCNYCFVIQPGGYLVIKENGQLVPDPKSSRPVGLAHPGDRIRIELTELGEVNYYLLPPGIEDADPVYTSAQPVDPQQLEEQGLQADLSVFDGPSRNRPPFTFHDVRICLP